MKKKLWIVISLIIGLLIPVSACKNGNVPSKITEKYSSELAEQIQSDAEAGKIDAKISTDGTVEMADGSTTNISIIQQIADKTGVKIDTTNPTEVGAFLTAFGKLTPADKLQYGIWGDGSKAYTPPETTIDSRGIIHDNTGQGTLTDEQNK